MSHVRAVQHRGRVAARVPEDPVGFWLGRLDVDTRPANRSHLNRWMRWLHRQKGWEHVSPRDVLIRQLEAEDEYVLLDLLQSYVSSLVLRKSGKDKAYSSIRSFFAHNRVGLRDDPSFRIRGDRPPVEAKLTVGNVIEAVHAATVRYQSIILFKWQSLLDNARNGPLRDRIWPELAPRVLRHNQLTGRPSRELTEGEAEELKGLLEWFGTLQQEALSNTQ